MTRKKKLVVSAILLAAFLLVDVAWGFIRTNLLRFGNKPSRIFVSGTMQESTSRGAFIESLDITPKRIPWNGKEVVVKEAWLERSTELVYVYVIIPFVLEYPHYRKVNGYHLCLNCSGDGLWAEPWPFFVVEGKGHGLSQQSPNYPDTLFCERLDSLSLMPTKILLTDDWNLKDRPWLQVKRAAE